VDRPVVETANARPGMTGHGTSRITAFGVAVLGIAWVAVVVVAGPPMGLYYATLAAWAVVPPLALVYAYCASHRSRASARLAVVATAAAIIAIGIAALFPEGSAV
jgi:hypothetical protein